VIRDILSGYLSRDATVLELGCGSGRHLEHLANHGFENLTGVDINAEAFDTMRETYPTLADGRNVSQPDRGYHRGFRRRTV